MQLNRLALIVAFAGAITSAAVPAHGAPGPTAAPFPSSVARASFTTCPIGVSRPDGTQCVDTFVAAFVPQQHGNSPSSAAMVSFFQVTYIWPNILLPFESAIVGQGPGTLSVRANMSSASATARLDLQDCTDLSTCSPRGPATISVAWQATGPVTNNLPQGSRTSDFLFLSAGRSQSRLASSVINAEDIPVPGVQTVDDNFIAQANDVHLCVAFSEQTCF